MMDFQLGFQNQPLLWWVKYQKMGVEAEYEDRTDFQHMDLRISVVIGG